MHIAIENLSKSFGSTKVLDSISLTLELGQIVVLLGPNGAGKTTLMRCFNGIISPDEGEVLYDDEPFRRDRIDLRQRMFFMPDFPHLYPDMKVLRHIGMVLELYNYDTRNFEDRVMELLAEFDLAHLGNCKLGTLSRGQAYKAALIPFLTINPELWILDEPFASGMDPRGLTAFQTLSRNAASEGRTVVYSTQILDVVHNFADRVCVIDDGLLHDFTSVDEFYDHLETSERMLHIFGDPAREIQ